MAIKYIDTISIDGAGSSPNRKLFGGYIFNLDYQIGVLGNRSEVTVNLWNDTGDFQITKQDLNWNKIYQINIGKNLVFNGYLIKYKLDKSTRKTLELKFADTSVVLDKYFIGLKNKHGQSSSGNVLIVGREFHPCDRDYDGDIDSIPDIKDECHPCRNQATKEAQFRMVDCKDMNYHQIFDVQYNFSMLIDELRKKFSVQADVTDPNPKYHKSTTGTVRDVLQDWCSDFGWVFYWENETIKFIDLRKTIDVRKKLSDYAPNVSSIVEEYSVDETFDRLVATYYQRQGNKDSYACEDAMHFDIPVLEPNRADLGFELQITDRIPHIAAGLIQYSSSLRDLWYWYDYYSLRLPRDYKYGKRMHKVGLEILSNPIMLDGSDPTASTGSSLDAAEGLDSSSLEPSTGLNRPNGMPSSPDPSSTLDFLKSSPPTAKLQQVKANILNNPKYKMCFELLKPEDQWVVANGLAKNKDDYFFFVGYHDENMHEEHKQIEAQYGAGFLNRYHVLVPNMNNEQHKKFFEDYTFVQDEVCGVKVKTNDAKIKYEFLGSGGDGSPEIFNTPSKSRTGDIKNLSELPFHKWLKIFRDSQGSPDSTEEDIQKAAQQRALMFKLLLVRKENADFYPSPAARYSNEPDEKRPKDEIKDPKLIGLAEKNAIIKILERNNPAGEFIPRKLLELTNTPLDKSIDRSKVFIFVGRTVGKDQYKIVTANSINPSSPIGNLFDGSPMKTKYQSEFDTKGEIFYKYEDLKCQKLGSGIPYCYRRSFKTPVATFTYYEPTYSPYGVVVGKSKLVEYTVPKLQLPIWDKKTVAQTVGRIEVVEKDITDDEIRIFRNESNTCRYDISKIKAHHALVSKHLSATVDSPSESFDVVVEGIDLAGKPTIADGLQSVKISMDSAGGITSVYSFGTTLFRTAKLDTLVGLDDKTARNSRATSMPPPPHKPQ